MFFYPLKLFGFIFLRFLVDNLLKVQELYTFIYQKVLLFELLGYNENNKDCRCILKLHQK